jgi:hypothetical protein
MSNSSLSDITAYLAGGCNIESRAAAGLPVAKLQGSKPPEAACFLSASSAFLDLIFCGVTTVRGRPQKPVACSITTLTNTCHKALSPGTKRNRALAGDVETEY